MANSTVMVAAPGSGLRIYSCGDIIVTPPCMLQSRAQGHEEGDPADGSLAERGRPQR